MVFHGFCLLPASFYMFFIVLVHAVFVARILLCAGLVAWIGEPSATRILLHEYSGIRAYTFLENRIS